MSDPTSISNLIEWWTPSTAYCFKDAGVTPVSADGDSIQQWNGKTGAFNLTQTTSANQFKWDANLGLVQGEYGHNEFMAIPAGVSINSRASTMFFVGDLVTLRDTYDGSNNQTPMVWVEAASDVCNMYYARGGSLRTYDGAEHSLSNAFLHSSPIFVCYVNSPSGTTIYVGNLNASLVALAPATASGGNFGGFSGASHLPLPARIRGFGLYSRAINATEVPTLFSWAQTLGVQNAYTSNVLFDGDSITSGVACTLNRNWPQQLGLAANVRQVCVAEASIQLSTLVTEAATLVDPWIVAGQTNVLVIFAGTNDLHFNAGISDSTVYNNLKTYCSARKTAGWNKIVVITALPRNPANSFTQANWQAYHDDIVNGFAAGTLSCDAVVDTMTDSRIGSWGANTNATYYAADQTHLNNTGAGILAGLARPAITQFLPVSGYSLDVNDRSFRVLMPVRKALCAAGSGVCF